MIAYTLSDLIVHVKRCVIASSTCGDFDYCIATWLRVNAVYDLNWRLIRRYKVHDSVTQEKELRPLCTCTSCTLCGYLQGPRVADRGYRSAGATRAFATH